MAYRQTAKTKARQLEVRQLLINSALELLMVYGFAAISIRRVAENAGLASGSVYKHFNSKADLCAQVFRLASETELARVVAETQGTGTATERLQKAINGFAQRAIKQPRLAYALIAEPVDPAVDEQRIQLRQDYADAFASLISEGISHKEFSTQNPDISAAALVGIISETLVGPLSRLRTKPTAKEQTSLVVAIQALCLRAVGAVKT